MAQQNATPCGDGNRDDLQIGGGHTLAAHPLRAAVLRELHARPFVPVSTPRRVLHAAFLLEGDGAQKDREALIRLCQSRGVPVPAAGARHHYVAFGGASLRWESHAEFCTYTWDLPCADLDVAGPDLVREHISSPSLAGGALPFQPPAATLASPFGEVPQPGPLLVAVDLHLLPDTAESFMLERLFNPASLARADVNDGLAEIASDFRADPSGYVRILVRDRGLGEGAAGALVQRLLEIETYRTLALLGLPEAQRLAPAIARIESRLAEVAVAMTQTSGFSDNHKLLDELVALAAQLEADSAGSLFRFGASRAYMEIVHLRLATIREVPVQGYPTWQQFLDRRMAPAMRTCLSVEERQGKIARKLTNAADLLRTRVNVELEQQNRDLLRSMNERTRMQLQLQSTVEGLSVAAISYYVVSLIHYLIKGVFEAGVETSLGFHLKAGMVSALLVPVVVLAVWWVVRRIRNAHAAHHDHEGQ
ncbi:DUF3422 family protein [Xanthobacter sp. TB0139]|uniref:DUF3422 family protein n=1 Tax=Xanthobacter sp. TB0139 TaxID=3459178 RepID=UPI00403A6162